MLVPLGDPQGRDCWLLKGSRDPLLLAVRYRGEVRVMDGLCPHAEAPMVNARITEDGDVMCPLHWWRFDPRTGAGLTDPGKPLQLYDVILVDGALHAVVPDRGATPQVWPPGDTACATGVPGKEKATNFMTLRSTSSGPDVYVTCKDQGFKLNLDTAAPPGFTTPVSLRYKTAGQPAVSDRLGPAAVDSTGRVLIARAADPGIPATLLEATVSGGVLLAPVTGAAATVWADQILTPSDLATSTDAGIRYVYVTDRGGGGLTATGGP